MQGLSVGFMLALRSNKPKFVDLLLKHAANPSEVHPSPIMLHACFFVESLITCIVPLKFSTVYNYATAFYYSCPLFL